MSTAVTSPTSAAAANSSTSSAAASSLQSLTVNDFTQMLVTELQNQDPTQPMSNTDLMNQVSQIQSIESNQQLTSTLQSVALGQSIASAGSLIGATVTGTNANGQSVTGTVNSASISNGAAILNVGSSTIPLNNVTQISPAGSSG
jgi:flagellar basal-body rod modification protein FlgD